MTPYEILLMLDPELPEERQSEIIQRTRELVERGGGNVESHDAWGRRKLAFEIDHKTTGRTTCSRSRPRPRRSRRSPAS